MSSNRPPRPHGAEPKRKEVPVTGPDDSDAPDVSAAAPEGATPEPGPQERIATLEDRLKRVQADFLNETRRIRQQAEERGRYAVEALVHDLLPVFDALHSARDGFAQRLGDAEQARTAEAALEGFDLVERELLNVLARHGVSRIEAEGAAFDPNRHHAIVMVEHPELDAGMVAKELRPGFLLHERVVRPSHVAVVAPREDASGDADPAQAPSNAEAAPEGEES